MCRVYGLGCIVWGVGTITYFMYKHELTGFQAERLRFYGRGEYGCVPAGFPILGLLLSKTHLMVVDTGGILITKTLSPKPYCLH